MEDDLVRYIVGDVRPFSAVEGSSSFSFLHWSSPFCYLFFSLNMRIIIFNFK
jgi:hypothetical protein